MKIEGPLDARARDILRRIPGVSVTAQPRGQRRRPDLLLHFAGTDARVELEVKDRANAATAWQLVHSAADRRNVPIILVANQATDEARSILRDHGIGLVDGAGNAHIELPGLLFHVEGRPKRTGGARPTRLSGRAGVVALALLLGGDRRWQVQELAAEAGVSVGLAHRVLDRLDAESIVRHEGKGPRRTRVVADPTSLLDLWTEENAVAPRRTLGYLLGQTPREVADQVDGGLEHAGVEHGITGAAAANLLAPFATAVPVAEVWVPAGMAEDELHAAAGTEAVATGHTVVFLQAKDDTPLVFRERVENLWLANRFRVYADLLRDPRRGREQAEHLRREVIGL